MSCTRAALLGVLLIAGAAQAADDTLQFSFAPPPITKPLAAGEMSNRFNLVTVTMEMPAATGVSGDMTGAGLSFITRQRTADGATGGNSQVGLFMMSGDFDTGSGTTTLDNLQFNFGFGLEGYAGDDGVMFLNLGLGMGVSTFDIPDVTLPGPITIPGTTVNSTSFDLGVMAGYQHNIHLGGNVVFTPYVYVNTIAGSQSNDQPGSEAVSYSSTSTTVGFDFLFDTMSLSTMVQSGDADITLIQLGVDF